MHIIDFNRFLAGPALSEAEVLEMTKAVLFL